jgi:hypothetical protein
MRTSELSYDQVLNPQTRQCGMYDRISIPVNCAKYREKTTLLALSDIRFRILFVQASHMFRRCIIPRISPRDNHQLA